MLLDRSTLPLTRGRVTMLACGAIDVTGTELSVDAPQSLPGAMTRTLAAITRMPLSKWHSTDSTWPLASFGKKMKLGAGCLPTCKEQPAIESWYTLIMILPSMWSMA